MAISKDRILYSDDHLLIVNKLPQELVVAAEGEGKLPLVDFLRKDYPGIRVLHRLDFGTSGCLAFARSKEAAETVKESKFAGWKKTYRALLGGRMERREGTLTKPLPSRGEGGDLVPATTHYRAVKTFKFVTDVEATIDTGRKHQIRRHFASIGHALLLDPLYGDKKRDKAFMKAFGYRRFFLHAWKLSLPHPVIAGKTVSVTAPLPAAYVEALQRLEQR